VLNLPFVQIERKEWTGPWIERPNGHHLQIVNREDLEKPHIRVGSRHPMGRPASRILNRLRWDIKSRLPYAYPFEQTGGTCQRTCMFGAKQTIYHEVAGRQELHVPCDSKGVLTEYGQEEVVAFKKYLKRQKVHSMQWSKHVKRADYDDKTPHRRTLDVSYTRKARATFNVCLHPAALTSPPWAHQSRSHGFSYLKGGVQHTVYPPSVYFNTYNAGHTCGYHERRWRVFPADRLHGVIPYHHLPDELRPIVMPLRYRKAVFAEWDRIASEELEAGVAPRTPWNAARWDEIEKANQQEITNA